MNSTYSVIRLLFSITPFKGAALVAWEISRRLYSNETFLIHQFDLTQPFTVPEPCLPLTVRELHASDVPRLLSLRDSDGDVMDARNRLERLLLIQAALPTCYVGVTADGHLCVMCWLIDHTANDKLQRYFNGGVLRLRQGEVLLENIFTHRAYRSKQLMQYLTFRLFEKAARDGGHKAFAYIKADNSASLKASKQIGWQPCGVKKVQWRLFQRHTTFDFTSAIAV